ncbi:DUF2460 domain-containing protein [Thioalbus denitrificans]|uniref:Uncharacterized protein (TIGR02217 family) n=1 Tax=Thioalbus denitrificans TaxID=547122 RepID=A0A369CEG5_9GAMM|nr:DUF2460 domain-containing protein [Thioalbus denitrificans]RCX32083.1 uncharacterized protein (TIGR02217 family) [Thioalbus denitrificans]
MGTFVDRLFPVERLIWQEMRGGILPPPVSSAGNGSLVQQRLSTTDEGQYRVTFPPQVRKWSDWVAIYEFSLGVGGRRDSFRLRDPRTYFNKRAGQALGAGDGVTQAYQLVASFGDDYTHRITKPVDGTVAIYIGQAGSPVAQTSRWSVGLLSGEVSFDSDLAGTVTGATSASPCVLEITGHGLTTGDTVHLGAFTGTGWSGLNDRREIVAVVDANHISIPVDSSAFPAYSANDGTTHTLPQAGEIITADLEWEFQVCLSSRIEPPSDAVVGRIVRLGEVVFEEVDE